jgi:hypothetical protein
MANKERGLWNTPASQAGEYAAVVKRGEQQDEDAETARKSEVLRRRSTGGRPDDDFYMREVGRLGIKRGQDSMKAAAADADARIQRRQPARTTKRTPPKSARRK